MSDYIKRQDVIDLINGLDSLPCEDETEELVNSLPTIDEKEMIRKTVERILTRLEERHKNHKNNIQKYQDRKDWDMCSRTSNIKVENEIAIEIVKEEGGIE